jgi:hypothetical protein
MGGMGGDGSGIGGVPSSLAAAPGPGASTVAGRGWGNLGLPHPSFGSGQLAPARTASVAPSSIGVRAVRIPFRVITVIAVRIVPTTRANR